MSRDASVTFGRASVVSMADLYPMKLRAWGNTPRQADPRRQQGHVVSRFDTLSPGCRLPADELRRADVCRRRVTQRSEVSSLLAAMRSAVPKPSVNRPLTEASMLRAWLVRRRRCRRRARLMAQRSSHDNAPWRLA